MRTLSLALVLLLATGCGSKQSSAAPPGARKRDELAKQMAGMSPEARAAYVRDHPEAMRTLSGQNSTTP